jgi:exopolysaccharide production protein ExoQ
MAGQFGGSSTVPVLLFISPWLWICARHPNAVTRSLLLNWPALALPLFALLSVVWSAYPSSTLRGGIQYLITAIIGVLAGSSIKPRILIQALLSALVLITALGVLAGNNAVSGDEVTLVGLFGSKNYFGLSVALLLITATIVVFDKQQPAVMRLMAVGAAFASPTLLVLSRSTGALVCTLAAMAVTAMLASVVRFAPAVRFAVLLMVAFIVLLLVIIWLYIGDLSAVLDSLGKDVTLTGRTWLWEWADREITAHPALGAGYQAFWQEGSWRAEEIWFHEQKSDKTGYHFHNTYLQVAVDLGFAGLLVLLATLGAICARIGSSVLLSRTGAPQFFAVGVFLFFLLRSPIEVDLFWPFQIPTVMLSLVWVYLGLPDQRTASARLAPPGAGPMRP